MTGESRHAGIVHETCGVRAWQWLRAHAPRRLRPCRSRTRRRRRSSAMPEPVDRRELLAEEAHAEQRHQHDAQLVERRHARRIARPAARGSSTTTRHPWRAPTAPGTDSCARERRRQRGKLPRAATSSASASRMTTVRMSVATSGLTLLDADLGEDRGERGEHLPRAEPRSARTPWLAVSHSARIGSRSRAPRIDRHARARTTFASRLGEPRQGAERPAGALRTSAAWRPSEPDPVHAGVGKCHGDRVLRWQLSPRGRPLPISCARHWLDLRPQR